MARFGPAAVARARATPAWRTRPCTARCDHRRLPDAEVPVPRPRFLLAIVLLPTLAACARPPVAVAEIAAAHPDATYEATATGCEWSGRRTVRRFDALSRAVAWGRQMAA